MSTALISTLHAFSATLAARSVEQPPIDSDGPARSANPIDTHTLQKMPVSNTGHRPWDDFT